MTTLSPTNARRVGLWLANGGRNRIVFGYRYEQAEFKDGALITEYTFDGPIAGFNFCF